MRERVNREMGNVVHLQSFVQSEFFEWRTRTGWCYDRDNRLKSDDESRVREVGSVILLLYQNAFGEVLSEVEQIEHLLVEN